MARRDVLIACFGYVLVGMASSALAGGATTSRGTTTWRLVGWVLSLAIFVMHIVATRRRHPLPGSGSAADVAIAVAMGAFVLAALGPVRSHWSDPHLARVAVLSLVAWPVLTGVPAFGVALLARHLLDR